ncbi:probable glutathione S-transferase GSTU6 [Hordeum vulgare subsp. vulgare]|uniref:Glutathione S-transferase n=1 Tax=Hordeum vulgare subsp. vulgare TaxID=112509 RepID=A0A8I6X2Q9_HORVV|nr:probable glutathione S-transferase GSTU6 [Hordeum vulgare subsp. vulgare]
MAGGEGGVKLLGLRLSPFVARVRMALDAKGVGYEYVEEDLAAKSGLLLASNPVHRKVPVLVHAGRPVCESLVILHYVDEAWPGAPRLLPAGARERAAGRFWAAYVDGELFPAWGRVMMAATEEELAERAGEAAGMVARLEEAFEECSGGGGFFGGDAVGYLDLVLGSNLFWLEALRRLLGVRLVDEGRTPLLAAWAGRFGEAAAANGVVTDALVDMAVEHAKKLRAAAMAAGK